MPLPFILAGVALAAAGYGVKKGIDALDADCEADEFIKKAESLKEEATKKAESAEFDCKNAFMRFGEKKLHVLSHTVSNFLDHFHRLNRSRIIIEGINMQDIQGQVSDARKITNQYREVDFFDVSGAVAGSTIGGVLAAYGTYTGVGMLASTAGGVAIAELSGVAATNATLAWLGGGALSVGGFGMVGGIAVLGGLVAGPALAQDAIATMKKRNYDTSRYNQKEKDQLCVTVSTLMTLSAFLKVPIMDEHQKLTEKAKNALNLIQKQINDLENRHD
ncbi:glycine zipper family protein [Helicobacter pylori]